MLNKKVAKQAVSLTWRFLVVFVVLTYPVFSFITPYMKVFSESSEMISPGAMAGFIIVLNIIIPFVIPWMSIYCALTWYAWRKNETI